MAPARPGKSPAPTTTSAAAVTSPSSRSPLPARASEHPRPACSRRRAPAADVDDDVPADRATSAILTIAFTRLATPCSEKSRFEPGREPDPLGSGATSSGSGASRPAPPRRRSRPRRRRGRTARARRRACDGAPDERAPPGRRAPPSVRRRRAIRRARDSHGRPARARPRRRRRGPCRGRRPARSPATRPPGRGVAPPRGVRESPARSRGGVSHARAPQGLDEAAQHAASASKRPARNRIVNGSEAPTTTRPTPTFTGKPTTNTFSCGIVRASTAERPVHEEQHDQHRRRDADADREQARAVRDDALQDVARQRRRCRPAPRGSSRARRAAARGARRARGTRATPRAAASAP